MKVVHLLSLSVTFALIACSGSGGGGSKAIYHPDVGPFDENGDYVVALADAPVRKNVFARNKKPRAAPEPRRVAAPRPDPVQRVAQLTPRAPVLPPAPRPVATPVSAPAPLPPAPRTVVIARSPRPQTAPIAPVPQPIPQPVIQTPPQPAVVAAPTPAPAPKPVLVKPKKKVPVRHVVTKSDTLFGLSRKYGVSVGSIQRANSIRGTTIVTGKTLLIPR